MCSFSADCPEEFVKTFRAMVHSGHYITMTDTAASCKEACIDRNDCVGFDFAENGWPKCVVHSPGDIMFTPLTYSTVRDNYKRIDSCKDKTSTYSLNLFRRYNTQFN